MTDYMAYAKCELECWCESQQMHEQWALAFERAYPQWADEALAIAIYSHGLRIFTAMVVRVGKTAEHELAVGRRSLLQPLRRWLMRRYPGVEVP